jgi:hypothetical protein
MFIETLYDLNRNFAEARAKRYVTNRLLLPESDYKALRPKFRQATQNHRFSFVVCNLFIW